jgi:hypothetical protein
MKKQIFKILFILTIIFIALTTVQCNTASLIIRNDDFQDTLYVYTDTIIPRNKHVPYSYDETSNLYKYKVFYDELVILNCRLKKIKTEEQLDDSVKAHLPIHYLKLAKKQKETCVFPNQKDIIDLFKKNSQGIVTY